MVNFTRRSVLRGSLGLAAAGTVARPYIANAAASTAEVFPSGGLRDDSREPGTMRVWSEPFVTLNQVLAGDAMGFYGVR